MGPEERRKAGPERPDGASPPPPTAHPPTAQPPSGRRPASRRLLVLGFTLAGLSLVLGVLTAIPAIVLGIVAVRRGRTAAGATMIALAIALPTVTFAVLRAGLDARAFRIPSEAMLPTFGVGDRVITTRGGEPRAGDIVVFEAPRSALTNECGVRRRAASACPRSTSATSEVKFIKRVVAGPGDRVAIVRGRAVVDGETLDEPYIRPSRSCPTCNLAQPITLPDGHYFVLGDNRGQSADSREWGPISEDSILGRVRGRYWPPARFGKP